MLSILTCEHAPCTINVSGPIQILVTYQYSAIRDINQEKNSLEMVDFSNTIHKTNTGHGACTI